MCVCGDLRSSAGRLYWSERGKRMVWKMESNIMPEQGAVEGGAFAPYQERAKATWGPKSPLGDG